MGPTKPMGYLPVATIELCSITADDMRRELEAKGLRTINADGGCHAKPALYAYDEQALRRLLDENKTILIEAKWPTEPAKFVRMVAAKRARVGTKLYNLIAMAFNNPSNIRPLQEYKSSWTYLTKTIPAGIRGAVRELMKEIKGG